MHAQVEARSRLVLNHPTRQAIAQACRETPRSVGEIARTLGRADGAVRATVQRLADYGVLEEAGGGNARTGRRARLYVLSPEWSRLIDTLPSIPAGTIAPAQQLLMVEASGLAELSRVLDEDATGVAWAVRFGDSSIGMLLAFDTDQPAAVV